MTDDAVNLSAEQWELYTSSEPEACAAAALKMNEIATEMFRTEKIERLNRKEITRVASRLYSRFSKEFGHLGAGDTEGRYAIENAVCAYLKAHGVDPIHDVDLHGDFLLWG